MSKIIDAAYNEGIEAFRNGKTVREIATPIVEDDDDNPKDQDFIMSRLIGFVDGLLEKLRAGL